MISSKSAALWQLLFAAIGLLAFHPILKAQTQPASSQARGLVWKVQGAWSTANGRKILVAGDSVSPGDLLQPDSSGTQHTLIALLPDGQRLFFDCFGPANCSRGFRVPQFNHTPDVFAIHLLDRVQGVMRTNLSNIWMRQAAISRPAPGEDEEVIALNPDGRITLSGRAASLPKGSYTYDLIRRDQPGSEQFGVPLTKSGGEFTMPITSPGVYELLILDSRQTARMDFFLLVSRHAAQLKGFDQAKKRLAMWNAESTGWPIHPLLRLYLLAAGSTPG